MLIAGLVEFQNELDAIFNNVPLQLGEKLIIGSLADLTADEINKLPTNLLYFLPVIQLNTMFAVYFLTLYLLGF